jgi:type I restriction enzyme, S subunit
MDTMTENKVVPKLRFREFEENYNSTKVDEIAEINPKNNNLPVNFVYIDLESVKKGVLLKENIISRNSAPSRAQRVLKKGDILYQSVRPYQKNNYLFKSKGDYVASTGYFQIKAKINNNYLYQYFHNNNFVNKVLKLCTGSNYPTIGFVDFGKISIKVPSLNEQKKIASFLSAVDEKIQQLTKKKELLEDYKKGIMQKIFSQEIRFKDDNGKEYPDWEEKKIGELFEFKQGVQCAIEDQSLKNQKGLIRFIRIIDLTKTDEPIRYIEDPGTTHHITNDDLFMVRYGNVGLVGYGYEGVIANNLFRIIPKESKIINNKFFYFLFRFKQRQLESLASSSTMPALSFTSLKTLTLKLLSFEEQKKIANFLSAIDNNIESVSRQLKKTKEFKKGLLQQMFV